MCLSYGGCPWPWRLVHTAELAANLEVVDSTPVRLNIVGPPKQPLIDLRWTSGVNMNGNNRVYILGILTALVLVGFVGCSSLPDCSPMVKYSESKLDIKGFELPVKPGIDVKIGEMVLEPQVVQKATDITQILDNHRISMCNQLKAARGVSKETHEKSLLRFQEAEVKLTQLAVLVAGNNPKAVEKWVESYEHEGKDLDAVSQLRSLDSLIADVSDIRERIKPWRLSPSQFSKLVEILSRGPKGEIGYLFFLGGDSDSAEFAWDLEQALRKGGWTINNRGMGNGHGLRGLEVGTDNPESQELKALLSAFSSARIPARIRVHPKWPSNTINLDVGNKP